MSALYILLSCVLASALGTSVLPTGRGTGTGQQTSYSITTGGQAAVPGALYNQPQQTPLQSTGPQLPYGGQYQLQTKLADGTVAGQYGYQTDGANVQVTYTAGTGQAARQQQPQSTYTTTGGETKPTTTDLLPESKTGITSTSTKTTGSTTATTTTTITGKDKTPQTDETTDTDTPSTYVIGQGQPGHTIYKLPAMGIYPNQAPTFGQGNPGFYYSTGTTFPASQVPTVHNKVFAPVAPFGNQLPPPPQHFTYAYSAPNAVPIPSNVYGFNSPFGFWNGRLPFPYTTAYSNFQQPAPFRQQQQHYFYGSAPGLINQFPSNQFPASPYVGPSNPGAQFPNRYYNLYYPQGNLHRYPSSIPV